MLTSDLSVFFRPAGVAVIGASREEHKLGHGVLRNLQSVGYTGAVYPVNPREDQILGYRAYPTIAAVPDPVDLAVLIVPAPAVATELVACGRRGIRGAIIVSGGFRETGPEGAAREDEIRAIAAQYQIRVLGPNCIGTIDTHTPLNTSFVVGTPHPGEIAFVSQSGAMAAAVMDWAVGAGVGFSRIVSLGNQVDVTSAAMLGEIARDPHTRVVTGYMEGVTDGPAFVASATAVARELPVVFVKAGRGSSGAKAVASHTGALAWQPLPRGNRVAILTNAGGPAILAADTLEAAGMTLAPLTAATRVFLRERVFAAASVENPVDILAGAGPATYALCLDALLADETVDAVVVIQAPQDWFKPVSLAEVVGEVVSGGLGRHKPVLTSLMGLATAGDATQILHRRRIPNYAFPERACSALGAMWRRAQWLAAQAGPTLVAPPPDVDTAAAARLVRPGGAARPAGWLAAEEPAALLAAYGIATPGSDLAATAEAAVAVAERVGFPVVLKLAATEVTHKTDIGGVVLNVRTPAEVRAAVADLLARVAGRAGLGHVQGVTVQHMVPAGVELIVGVVRDPQFGPLVMAGLGGTAVELRREVAFDLAPLTPAQADELLDRTAAGRLLAGFRGAPPADRAAVTATIGRLAQLALDWPEIAEIEINPLIAGPAGAGASAVDARVRLDAPAAAALVAAV